MTPDCLSHLYFSNEPGTGTEKNTNMEDSVQENNGTKASEIVNPMPDPVSVVQEPPVSESEIEASESDVMASESESQAEAADESSVTSADSQGFQPRVLLTDIGKIAGISMPKIESEDSMSSESKMEGQIGTSKELPFSHENDSTSQSNDATETKEDETEPKEQTSLQENDNTNGKITSQETEGKEQENEKVKPEGEQPEQEQEGTPEQAEGKPKRKKPAKRRRGSAAFIDELNSMKKITQADDLFEYQWPQEKNGDYFMLQEQVSEYLGVLSFKRKYPDLPRRPLEYLERVFLKDNGIVTEVQCDLGLTALRSEDVMDLLHKDYPAKYQEYLQVVQKRERQKVADKHKEYGLQQSMDKNRMSFLRKKALKSAADFNTHFMKEWREERKAYFDLQTYTVHYPRGKMFLLDKEATKPGHYPTTLIPGQFQDYYKQYTPQELKYFPVNSVTYGVPKSVKGMPESSQGVASDSEEEVVSEGSVSSSGSSSSGSGSGFDSDSDADTSKEVPEATAEFLPPVSDLQCAFCQQGVESNRDGLPEEIVTCSECKKNGHPSCFELTEEMTPMIKTYPWQCMECKTCVECMDPYDEDKMMFCDHCDRGYHTFCVGLRGIPTGRWDCPSCHVPEPKPKRKRR